MSEGFEGARDLLDAFAGFRATGPNTSAELPIRLGVVDPGYSGGLVPVRFEGEATPGVKRYAVLSSYSPQPDDRVALAPVGQTWLILGAVDGTPSRFPEWQPITSNMYANSWAAFTSNEFQADPEFIRSSDGWVKLKGLISGGSTANGSTVLTLPEGYRPTGQLHFPTVSSVDGNSITGDRSAMLRVRPDGAVTVGFGVASFWLSLDSITFVAEV